MSKKNFEEDDSYNSIDTISIEQWEGGELVLKVLDKEIISEGTWPTIAFLYQKMNRLRTKFLAPGIMIIRYHKLHGVYHPLSKVVLANSEQISGLIQTLQNWQKIVQESKTEED